MPTTRCGDVLRAAKVWELPDVFMQGGRDLVCMETTNTRLVNLGRGV